MNLADQPLQLADGRACLLIPGKHSTLQIAVIEEFGPRFAPGATVLYLSDVLDRVEIYEKARLKQLGIVATTLDELPDVVLYHTAKDRLYFVEAGVVRRAITHKRRRDVEQLSKRCDASRIYVSAFLNFPAFGKYIPHIAWESYIWIATHPDHTIYFNGGQEMTVHE